MSIFPTEPVPTAHSHDRKVKYIDHAIQKWLLIALVVLELIVLSVAGAVLYFRLNSIVEENLYRIHLDTQHSMLSVLLIESLWIIGGMIVVNLLALFAADRIWVRYVNGILADLRRLLSSIRELDFRNASADVHQRHEVLALSLAWRKAERARHVALRKSIDLLATQSSSNAEEFRNSLLAARAQLPDRDM